MVESYNKGTRFEAEIILFASTTSVIEFNDKSEVETKLSQHFDEAANRLKRGEYKDATNFAEFINHVTYFFD
jgi:hypothetical protein